MDKFVVGILAHVDSGKTTLSEALLYKTGEIRKIGRVDHKDAFLDTHLIERQRGITIFSKQAEINQGDVSFTLLDTPGHVDFSAEMERTLSVLDYAILVISGVDGVQNHTETLWKLLSHYNIPTFIFINKMDISSRTKDNLISDIQKKLGKNCFDFSENNIDDTFYENIASCNEDMMEEYFDKGIVNDENIKNAIFNCELYPCLFGSALKLDGIEEFIDFIKKYMKKKQYKNVFGAKVFKISEDEQGVRLTHLKVTGGSLKVKTLLSGVDINKELWNEKINQIRIYSGTKYEMTDEVPAGAVCVVTGLTKTFPGQGIGEEQNVENFVSEPVLNYKVYIDDNTDVHTVLTKLRELQEEETKLNIVWNEYLQEIHVCLMGEIQLEVLKQVFFERYKINISFGQGNIVYRETIEESVIGMGHFEPLRHYAEVHLLMEPLKRGEGLQFSSECSEDELERNWQRLILTHLKEKNHVGVLTGSFITDMKITLIAGKAHKKHTEGGDFRQATYRAVRHGLRNAKSVLLEPYYDFILEVPVEMTGRAMTDINNMGGEFSSPETYEDYTVIKGSAPVSEMRDYHKDIISYTRGKGRLNCTLKGYFKCHNTDEVIEKIGYDCEHDTDNTADSVFCANGAGFTVKWDCVKDYVHLDSGIRLNKDEEFTPQITERKVRDYIDSLEEDKELMKIFERTYGPIKRDIHSAMHTKKQVKENPVKYKASPLKNGPGYLLVDGYNIIFAIDELKKLAEKNLDLARNRLITLLCNYRAFINHEIIAVFDAYKVKNNPGEVEKVGNISVVYTKEAETADMYIEKVSHELSKKHFVKVATSDGLEQLIIIGNGAFRITAEAFYKEISEVEKTISEFINKNQ